MTEAAVTEVGLYCSRFEAGRRWGRSAFAGWLVVATTTALAISYLAYGGIYAATLQVWPKGYNP